MAGPGAVLKQNWAESRSPWDGALGGATPASFDATNPPNRDEPTDPGELLSLSATNSPRSRPPTGFGDFLTCQPPNPDYLTSQIRWTLKGTSETSDGCRRL